MAIDPVCGMDVEPDKAAAKSTYGGKEYYFCAEMCKKKFDADPEKYLEKSPQTEKPKASIWSKMFPK